MSLPCAGQCAFAGSAPVRSLFLCTPASSALSARALRCARRPRVVACADEPNPRYGGTFSRRVSSPAPRSNADDGAQPPPAAQQRQQQQPLQAKSEQPESPASGNPLQNAVQPDQPDQPAHVAPAKRPWWKRIVYDAQFEDLRTFGASFAVALLIRAVAVEPRFIPSESMYPTFEVGDQLLVEKVTKYVRPPHAGDVVVFMPPPALIQRGYSETDAFIKRVVGTSGDTVRVLRGHLVRNGVEQAEPYIAAMPEYEWGPAEVPEGYVMVLGDNRNNSYDSHIWGFLPTSNIIGRAVVRYWPPARFGSTIAAPLKPVAEPRPNIAPDSRP